MTEQSISPAIMRSVLGRARGLGSAKSGTATWFAERVTAVALVPLTLWLAWSVIRLAGQPRAVMMHWVSNPLVATTLMAVVLVTFRHMQLALQTVMEDYIHNELVRMISLLVMKGAVALLCLAAAIAVLKMAITG
jgi:succinate dehydrogenase / fumarate reductase membrane anchor subunit